MMVLMTLREGDLTSTLRGFFKNKRRQLERQSASCQHFTFCLSPREASTEPLGKVMALPAEAEEVAQPGSRLCQEQGSVQQPHRWGS